VYGGTYFPRERWLQALQSVLDTRAQDPGRVEAYATQLTAGVQQAELVNVPPLEGSKAWGTSDAFGPADAQLLDDGIAQWKDNWDPKWGGNDRAPKFPIPTNLDFLLHYGTVRGDSQASGPRPKHLAQDGTRRDPRSHRWWICPLQRGRKMARATFRKRCSTTTPN
jgi:uncharacterized protein YyaL (SSP411 family)